MADFAHIGVVNAEIRTNSPSTKAFERAEPQLDQGAFPGTVAPGFASVSLPGMSGREVSISICIVILIFRAPLR